jgi:hypothetical protein
MLNDDGEDVAEELIRSSASDVDDLIIGRAAPCSDTQVGSMRPKPRLSVTMASLGIPLIEGHLAVAGSGLAFPLAAARETFANLPGIERREMSTESFSICDAAFGIHLKRQTRRCGLRLCGHVPDPGHLGSARAGHQRS